MLGWDDHTIMTTPLARLHLAIKGRADFVKNILQACFGKPEEDEAEKMFRESRSDPAAAAAQLQTFFTRRRQQDALNKRKK